MNSYIDRLKKLDTTCVSDAMDRLGIACGLLGIKPVIPGVQMCGEAFTVHYIPCGTNKGTVGDFLDEVQSGQVVVIDNGGRNYCTVWGDIMTATSVMKGIAGTLIDGVCRDIPGIQKFEYPVFSKGYYMVTGKDRVEVDAVNIPVAVSGVQVSPGDIILGDNTGAVVIPKAYLEKVVQIAEEIDEKEKLIIALVKEGHALKEAREKMGYHNLQTKK
jgi:regulator of RNase E activity RraA